MNEKKTKKTHTTEKLFSEFVIYGPSLFYINRMIIFEQFLSRTFSM